MILFQITAPHFCAGGEIRNREVIVTAPIIKYMVGWDADTVFKYCTEKKWKIKSYKNEPLHTDTIV